MKKANFCFLIIVAALLSNLVFGAIPASERAALIALYNSTNGDHWTRHSGWKTPPLDTDGFAMPGTEGSWAGVQVGTPGDKVSWAGVKIPDNHVYSLSMNSNQMSGSIPPELGNLIHLEECWLDHNQLSGGIPPELGNITSFYSLSLNDNQLSGSIPSQLGNLVGLRFLFLHNNLLSGSIPPELGSLSNLKSLDLNNNDLSGGIPSQLGNLNNLGYLNLSENQLGGGIPLELGNLGKLKELLLIDNSLSGVIPPELGNLSLLEKLRLNANYLSGSIPSQLSNLNNLLWLDLYNNQLSGGIPIELGNLSKLKELDLGGNNLTGGIPSQLGNLNNLEVLTLNGAPLGGGIPSQLGNLSNLSFLDLSGCRLGGAIPSQLGNLSNLKYLNLLGNRLTGGIPSQLGNLDNLEALSLHSNALSGSIPPGLGNLGNLKSLSLENNQLSGDIPPGLGNLTELTSLDLSNNLLNGGIPSELGNLGNLYALNLFNNLLSGTIPSSLINLSQINDLDIKYNCLSAADPALITWLDNLDPDWELYQDQCAIPEIVLNRTRLNFSIWRHGYSHRIEKILISNRGSGKLHWSIEKTISWLEASPGSGSGDSIVSLLVVDDEYLSEGTYTGTIQVTDLKAPNSPQTITATLHIYDQGQTAAPFGAFETPLEGAAVCNSIAVSGWALDDIGVANVKIYNDDTYIGDALFVEGARPDVETAFPTYPNNYKAGWGYMLLTNFLPNGGNGTYTLIAKATDMEGNEVTLGSKTITIDNAHSVKPFGAIDTPTQGGTASGINFVNYGWALTPQPNSIAVDGTTINVYVDGVVKGRPVYNIFRSDIATLFPGYANTDGAVGYYYLDTTKLSNGVHTIAWTVTDNAGNSDGIGSRYFTVQNSGTGDMAIKSFDQTFSKGGWQPQPIKAGSPSECGGDIDYIEIKELERVEINLSGAGVFEGYSVVGDQLRELPIGSTLDKYRGVFYWQPGPGFVGEYRLVFIGKNNEGQIARKNIVVNIKPMHLEEL